MSRWPILLLLPLLLTPHAEALQDDEAPVGPDVEITPEAEQVIQEALQWLADHQNRNGSFGNGSAPVATTALAGLAFLAGGHVPGRSRFGDNVKRAARFLLRNAGRRGYINEGQARGMGGSGMHGHGYATVFFAELYGMTSDRSDVEFGKLKEVLTNAVAIIQRAQNRNGGWNYEPNPGFDEGSVTVTQVEALRAARNAGILVDNQTIERAIDYINKSTNSAGQTQYSLTSGGRTSFALTAAGMSVLNYLGQYNNEKVKKGCDFLLRHLPGRGTNSPQRGAWGGWFFYGNYYATIALYHMDGEHWKKWFPAVRENLIKIRGSDGSWHNAESASYGPSFGTAMALLILQLPYRYLPIFQRGED